jgi:hypothetical protein
MTYYNCLQIFSLYSSLFESEFKIVKDASKLQSRQLNSLLSRNAARFSWARSVFGSTWVLPYIAKANGSLCCLQGPKYLSYGISVRLQALFCLKAFCIELRLKRASFFSVQISPTRTELALKNVVPADSKIMVACQAGDTSVVYNLLNEQKASVNDITPDNFSPLSVCPNAF